MELFSVNRYTTDASEKPQTNEKENLQKLLKKVEKRKRKKASKVAAAVDETNQNVKKLKEVSEDTTPNAENNDAATLIESELNLDSSPTADNVDFKVLGEDVRKQQLQRVNMVLPSWLAHPTIIGTSIASADTTIAEEHAIANLDFLEPHIKRALKDLKITRLFPVQHAVIPWILDAHYKPFPFRPRDICVSAPTGSGKTLAFAIPVVQLLANRVVPKIRALVVLPVIELALQVYKVFKKLCDNTDLTVCLLSKQIAFTQEQEKLVKFYKGQYHSKVDIVVTTPGRLVDHLHATKGFCLKSLNFLVIDEADRIMDAVFQNWLYHVDSHVREASDQLLSGRAPPLCLNELEISAATQPHKLLFSATLSQDPEKLQNLRLFQPKLFTSVLPNLKDLGNKLAAAANDAEADRGEFIGKYTTPAELTEKYCLTENRLKPLTLFSLINEHEWTKFLCFTNSAESSTRLAFVLQKLFKDDMVISDLSASKNANERSKTLSRFISGKIRGLICSDALARGIDVPDVDIVISYDPARHIKTYIHRIGRTARAGRPGTAITLLSQNEYEAFKLTLASVGKAVTAEISAATSIEEEHAGTYASVLNELRYKVEHDKRNKKIMKERARMQKDMHKDPAQLTLMEKLQMQVNIDVQQSEAAAPIKKDHKKNKNFKPKKFNPSAGKNLKFKK